MGSIVILDENTSNKIAAGEVIERPASVVKELVENSIDAGASSITVEIKNGGISLVKVSDNGSGINEDDVEIAFERHATSKIRNSNDLEYISTLGFRGEALASIAAVSTVELTSRVQENTHGMFVKIKGGTIKDVKQTGCPVGTVFAIKDLFFNTPARYKFLKKDSTEAGYVSDIISRMALGNPQISFRLINNNANILHTPGNNDLISTIFSIYGKEVARGVHEISYDDGKIKIKGYAGKPEIARSNRNQQSIFVNGRFVKSKVVSSAIDEAYKTFLMKNKFAFIVMNIEVNPLSVDVNVHPTKIEVRFSDEQDVFRAVYHAVNSAILNKPLIKEESFGPDRNENYKYNNESFKAKENYAQERISINNNSFIKEKGSNEYNHTEFPKFENNINYGDNTIIEKIEENVKVEDIKIYDKLESVTQYKETKDIHIDTDNETRNKIEDEKTGPIDIFADSMLIGQAFSTYIILQDGEDLLLIDQHAAHERIMYEGLKEKYYKNEPMEQFLLSPVVIELTYQELKYLEESLEILKKLGFNYDSFGNNSIILRTVPYVADNDSIKQIFMEVVDQLVNSNKNEFNIISDETLYTIACKAAVKANKKLDELEIKNILKELMNIENPYTCPHGRPVIIKITKHELEKRFKRIV